MGSRGPLPRIDDNPMEILLVENNREDARHIDHALAAAEGLDCHTHVADRLSRGLAALSEQAFDVVLLDLSLPESSGIETFEKMRGAVNDIPIVVLLDDDHRALVPQAARQGAKGVLFKGSISASRLYPKHLFRGRTRQKRTGPALQGKKVPHLL